MRLARFCKPWACALRRLGQDRRGGVAVFLAVMLIPLVGFVGISIDTARAYFLTARLYQALDAAALAGGRVFFEEDRNQDIKDFFAANLGEENKHTPHIAQNEDSNCAESSDQCSRTLSSFS